MDQFGAAPRWLLCLSDALRRLPWRGGRRAAAVGRRPRAAAAVPARHHAALHAGAAVLDRQERDQDDRHAVLARFADRPGYLERGRLARGEHEAAAADLCPVELGHAVRARYRPFASSSTTSHSSSRTGATDRRDWRISSIFARRGSALISASVTGRGSAFTGSTRTRTQSGAFGSGSASRVTRMIPTTALSDIE